MKKLWTLGAAAALAAVMAAPTLASELRARIKAVSADTSTVTVIEGNKDYSLTATAATQFLNVKGGALANGIRSGDLRPGRRVVVNYDTRDGKQVLTSLRIRP